jgi:adenylate kinase
MKILVTGTPGVGKTTLAKNLAKKFKCTYLNEKDFALKNGIGEFGEDNELEIPIKLFEKKMNLFLRKTKNIVVEGHLLCEMKLRVDVVILITLDPEELQLRLSKREYSEMKIMDNVFCEGIEYCKKKLNKNYSKFFVINSKSSSKGTLNEAISIVGAMKSSVQSRF